MESLYLRGEDVGGNTYWAWEWIDGLTPPEFVVIQRNDVRDVLAELDAALPGMLEEERELETEQLSQLAPSLGAELRDFDYTGEALRELVMVNRCMTGALVDSATELALFTRLGEALLPDRFVKTLRERIAIHGRDNVEVRVLPAPSCVRVPWELLVTAPGTDERLLDLVRVVTMAPLLGRDGDASVPHPNWEAAKHHPPLFIVDPDVPGVASVLDASQRTRWTTHAKAVAQSSNSAQAPVAQVGQETTRTSLSMLLNQPRSRFVYVGHVTASDATQGKTAMMLADVRDIYGLGGMQGATRPFTAQDLVAGTMGFEAHRRALGNRHALPHSEVMVHEFGDDISFPPGTAPAQPGEDPRPVLGKDIWPMPPRVALIACHSGADFQHAEPFGLVTAILDVGAEMVVATRWVLLTDRVFGVYDGGTPLNDMAFAADEVIADDDPLAALATWQRRRLAAWRESGHVKDSPLSWGAMSITHAPDRTQREEVVAV